MEEETPEGLSYPKATLLTWEVANAQVACVQQDILKNLPHVPSHPHCHPSMTGCGRGTRASTLYSPSYISWSVLRSAVPERAGCTFACIWRSALPSSMNILKNEDDGNQHRMENIFVVLKKALRSPKIVCHLKHSSSSEAVDLLCSLYNFLQIYYIITAVFMLFQCQQFYYKPPFLHTSVITQL